MMPPAADIDRIMAVMRTAFDPAFGEAWTRRQVEDALLVGNCHYGLIATDASEPKAGDDVAGFYLSRYGLEEEELLLLGVDPLVRRRGLGSALLKRFAASARRRGAQRLCLEMRRGNPAERLYLNFGYVTVGERRDYYRAPDGGRFDAITFVFECK